MLTEHFIKTTHFARQQEDKMKKVTSTPSPVHTFRERGRGRLKI